MKSNIIESQKVKSLIIIMQSIIILILLSTLIFQSKSQYIKVSPLLGTKDMRMVIDIFDRNSISYKVDENQIFIIEDHYNKATYLLNTSGNWTREFVSTYPTPTQKNREKEFKLAVINAAKRGLESIEWVEKITIDFYVATTPHNSKVVSTSSFDLSKISKANTISAMLEMSEDYKPTEKDIEGVIMILTNTFEDLDASNIHIIDQTDNVLFDGN